jgi:hypothetical protein
MKQQLKLEFSTKIYDGDIDLEKMHSDKMEEIIKDYYLRREYQYQMESQWFSSS